MGRMRGYTIALVVSSQMQGEGKLLECTGVGMTRGFGGIDFINLRACSLVIKLISSVVGVPTRLEMRLSWST